MYHRQSHCIPQPRYSLDQGSPGRVPLISLWTQPYFVEGTLSKVTGCPSVHHALLYPSTPHRSMTWSETHFKNTNIFFIIRCIATTTEHDKVVSPKNTPSRFRTQTRSWSLRSNSNRGSSSLRFAREPPLLLLYNVSSISRPPVHSHSVYICYTRLWHLGHIIGFA